MKNGAIVALATVAALALYPAGRGSRARSSSRFSSKAAGRAVIASLSPELRKKAKAGRSDCHVCGHCYVASEAAWHLMGGKRSGWHPLSAKHRGVTHWWLERDDGQRMDLTSDQFPKGFSYGKGRRRGFLTTGPSERAQVVMRRARKRLRRRGSRNGNPMEATIDKLWGQLDQAHFERWGREPWGIGMGDDFDAIMQDDESARAERRDLIAEYLEDQANVTVREDGLLEFWTLTPGMTEIDPTPIIGDLPVALYHHTSTGALQAIRRQGLRSDVPRADELSTGAGVYLTTEYSGAAVGGYLGKARRLHGGDGVTLTVRRRLWELEPDPDDADIRTGWVQFVTGYVSVEDIIEWE